MMIKFIKIIIEISYFPPFLLLLLLSNPKLKSKKYSGFQIKNIKKKFVTSVVAVVNFVVVSSQTIKLMFIKTMNLD